MTCHIGVISVHNLYRQGCGVGVGVGKNVPPPTPTSV
jgi:hypothetical protein